MAGRGRGRGRGGSLNINIEAFGLGRGDILTPIQSQPPPLFPPSQFKPVPLSKNEEFEYQLALKQELRDLYRKSPFYIHPPKKMKDIERYSDKYQIGVGNSVPKLNPFWDRLPFELRERKKRKGTKKIFKPNLKSARLSIDNVTSVLEKLEKDASQNDENEDEENEDEEDEKKAKKDEDEEGEEDEEEYDDEDIEENDYNMNYFDNGEGYGDDDDDDDDANEGATY